MWTPRSAIMRFWLVKPNTTHQQYVKKKKWRVPALQCAILTPSRLMQKYKLIPQMDFLSEDVPWQKTESLCRRILLWSTLVRAEPVSWCCRRTWLAFSIQTRHDIKRSVHTKLTECSAHRQTMTVSVQVGLYILQSILACNKKRTSSLFICSLYHIITQLRILPECRQV